MGNLTKKAKLNLAIMIEALALEPKDIRGLTRKKEGVVSFANRIRVTSKGK